MKKPLHIYFDQILVGTLIKKPDDTLAFQYAASWLNNEIRFPMSPALPLQEEAFNNRSTKAYFDNLLPEGDTLKTFENILKRSFEDPYQFLEKYGLDCAGAFEIIPADAPRSQISSEKLIKITFEEIDTVLSKGQNLYAHSITAHGAKFSLAGAQDKIPVIYRDGELFWPAGSTPTTHILKPPARLSNSSNSVFNEYFCMRLAKLCGLAVPEVQIVGRQTSLYLVSRYDRRISENRVTRIHQFDLCQAQGYPAGEKYEIDGGPDFAQNYKCIETISDNKIPDLEAALNWLAFNLLIGNNDSHSKNLSFIRENQQTRVAPLYDLLSTSIYPEFSPDFAFQIGGQRLWHNLRVKNLEMFAHKLGYVKRPEIIMAKVIEMAKQIINNIELLLELDKEAMPQSPVYQTLAKEIGKRASFFSTRFNN